MWRIAAINEAGGWKDRTTVEDMDLAVRAGLKGWKFLYLGDLQVSTSIFHQNKKKIKKKTLIDELIFMMMNVFFFFVGEKRTSEYIQSLSLSAT